MSNSYDPAFPPPGPYREPEKKGCGCWAWGCLSVVLLAIVGTAVIGFVGYRALNVQIAKYTDTEPVELPVVQYDESQMTELEARLERFRQQVRSDQATDGDADAAGDTPVAGDTPTAGQTPAEDGGDQAAGDGASGDGSSETLPDELVLTADDINALINQNESLANRAFVRIEGDQLAGEISVPLEGVPLGDGRYLNASVKFKVSMVNDRLDVRLVDAEVKGDKVPDEFVEALAGENLASNLYQDEHLGPVLRQLEDVRIEDQQLILKLRPAAESE